MRLTSAPVSISALMCLLRENLSKVEFGDPIVLTCLLTPPRCFDFEGWFNGLNVAYQIPLFSVYCVTSLWESCGIGFGNAHGNCKPNKLHSPYLAPSPQC